MAANPFTGFKKLKDSKAQFRNILSKQQELINCKPSYPLYQQIANESTNKKASRSACCTSKDPSTSSISKKRKKSLAEVVNSLFHEQSEKKKISEQRMSVDKLNANSLGVDLFSQTGLSAAHPMLKRRARAPLAATPDSKKIHTKSSSKASKPRHTSSVEIGRFHADFSAIPRSQNKVSILKHLAAVGPYQNTANSKKQYHLPIEGLFGQRHHNRVSVLKSEHSKGSGINTVFSGYPVSKKSQQVTTTGDFLEHFYNRLCELVETSKLSEKKKLKAISKMFLDYARLVESLPNSVPINHRMNRKILEFFSHFTFVNTKAYLETKKLLPFQKLNQANRLASPEDQNNIHRRSFDITSKNSRAASFDKSTRNLRANDEPSSDDSNIEKELEMNHDESGSQTTPVKLNTMKMNNQPDPRYYRTNDLQGDRSNLQASGNQIPGLGWPSASENLYQQPIYQQSEYNQKKEEQQKPATSPNNHQPETIGQFHQVQQKHEGLPRLEYETTLSRLKISQIQTEKSIVFEEEKVKLFRPPK